MSKRYEKVDDENFREIEEKTTPLKMSELQQQKADWELVLTLTPQQLVFAVMQKKNQTLGLSEVSRLTKLINDLGKLTVQGVQQL